MIYLSHSGAVTSRIKATMNHNGMEEPGTSGIKLHGEGEEGPVSYTTPIDKIQKIKRSLDSVSYLAYLPDGQLVVSDTAKKVVRIYDTNGKYLSYLAKSIRPLGVATSRSGMVSVVDIDGRKENSLIKVYGSDSGEMFSQWGNDKRWRPRAVTFSNKGQLVITSTHNTKHEVGIFTLDGRELHSFGSLGAGTHQFKNPWYVTVDMFDRILVSDRDNNVIKIFDDKGKYLGCLGGPGSGRGSLFRPHGLCTDSRGNVIVCDAGNRRICVFSVTGKYLQDLVTEDDFLRYPWGIAYSRTARRLAVSQSGQLEQSRFRKIRVFDLPELAPLSSRQSF